MIQPGHIISQIYKDLKLLELSQLIELENNKLAYKIYHKLLPSRMLEIINCDTQNKTLSKKHRYNTRNKNVPNLPKAKNMIYHRSFLYCGLKSLSNLHEDILNWPSINRMIKTSKKTIPQQIMNCILRSNP